MKTPSMKVALNAAVLALVVASVPALNAQSTRVGNPKPPTPSGRKADTETAKAASRGAGQDPNIKRDRDAVRSNRADLPAPSEKSGARGTSALCDITVDNYSANFADVYVDGDYRGTVAPYGDGNTWAVSGPTVLYAKADDGGSWGPMRVSCNSSYYWRLRP